MTPSSSRGKSCLLIQGGRILDPARGIDFSGNVYVKQGKIARVTGPDVRPGEEAPEGFGLTGATVLQAKGMVVCPGFIDLHCHLREPGFEEKETIATGTAAAARGGFTTVCCMPNTEPPLDSAAAVAYVKEKAKLVGRVRVLPIGCITSGRKGEELAEMGELEAAGVVAFSDDGRPVASAELMRHAMEYSRLFGLPIIDHCEDLSLSNGGVMNEGRVSAFLGLRGIPAAAEEVMVARDVTLAALTGARVHIAHVSSAGSVDIIRGAKEKGIPITAEVTPHHITLTEELVLGAKKRGLSFPVASSASYDANAKVNPPLRTEEDVAALIEGLKDGTIDAIATDHAPHALIDKVCEFDTAAFGISGLETAFSSLMGLVWEGSLSLPTLVSRLTAGPARVLGREGDLGSLEEGRVADITVFDPERMWVVRPDELVSKGKNTPLSGQKLRGKVMATIVEGEIVFMDQSLDVSGVSEERVER